MACHDHKRRVAIAGGTIVKKQLVEFAFTKAHRAMPKKPKLSIEKSKDEPFYVRNAIVIIAMQVANPAAGTKIGTTTCGALDCTPR